MESTPDGLNARLLNGASLSPKAQPRPLPAATLRNAAICAALLSPNSPTLPRHTFTFSFVKNMSTHFPKAVIAASCALGVAFAAPKPWDGSYTSFSGTYLLYSHDLDEKAPPTAKDRRVSFKVEGALARKLFESIGPDQKEDCGASSELSIRNRGDLTCTFDKSDRNNPYTCHFGLNLLSGKSIAGSTC